MHNNDFMIYYKKDITNSVGYDVYFLSIKFVHTYIYNEFLSYWPLDIFP